MSATEQRPQPSAEEVVGLIELTEIALAAQSIEELGKCVPPGVARMTQSSAAVLYIGDARLCAPRLFTHGLPGDAAPA